MGSGHVLRGSQLHLKRTSGLRMKEGGTDQPLLAEISMIKLRGSLCADG